MTPAMSDGPIVLHSEPELQIATWRRVFINIWRARRVSLRLLETIARCESEFSQADPSPHALITVVDADVALGIEDDAKKLSVRHAKAMDRHVDAHVQVVMGTGIKRYAAIAVIKATFALSRPSYPTKVTRDFQRGVDWLVAHHGTAAPELAAMVARLYRDQLTRAGKTCWD